MEYRYNVNDAAAKRRFELMKKLSRKHIELALTDSMNHIGLTAVSDFMVPSPGPHGSRLGIRTSRLSRSLIAAPSFAGGASGAREQIRRINISRDNFKAEFGTEVPYGAIHEFGGTIRTRHARIGMPARPYLNPALQASEGKVEEFFQQRMTQLVNEVNASG